MYAMCTWYKNMGKSNDFFKVCETKNLTHSFSFSFKYYKLLNFELKIWNLLFIKYDRGDIRTIIYHGLESSTVLMYAVMLICWCLNKMLTKLANF